MTCQQIEEKMNEILDSKDPNKDFPDLREHLSSCESCSQSVELMGDLLTLNQLIEVPSLEPDFKKELFSNLGSVNSAERLEKPTQLFHWLPASLISAAIAAVLVFFVMSSSILNPSKNTKNDPILTAELEPKKEEVINIVFHSLEDLNNAQFTIELPKNVELIGYPSKRSLSWNVSLKKGANHLNLKVIAHSGPEGRLVAKLKYQGKTREFLVSLKLKKSGNA